MIFILGQTLKLEFWGKLLLMVEKTEDEIAALLTGNLAVPTIELDCDYNTAKGRWHQIHFVRCILEGSDKRVLRL